MKNRFVVSILEALEQISDQHPAMGKAEVLASLSAIDNMTWQLLDEIKSQNSVKPAKAQHRLSPAERN